LATPTVGNLTPRPIAEARCPVLKKIRRMVALQALMWSAALYFGWKHREAVERSVRAARAAWDANGDGSPSPVGAVEVEVEEVYVATVVAPDGARSGAGETPLDGLVDAMPTAAEAAGPGY
jgi:hypothetical protein